MCDSDPTLGSPGLVVLATPDSQVNTETGEQPQPLSSIEHDHTYSVTDHTHSATDHTHSDPAREEVGVLSQELFSGEADESEHVLSDTETCSADMEIVDKPAWGNTPLQSDSSADVDKPGGEISTTPNQDGNSTARPLECADGECPAPNLVAETPCVEPEPDMMELDSVPLTLERVRQDFVSLATEASHAHLSVGHTHNTEDPLVDQVIKMLPCLELYVDRSQQVDLEQLHVVSEKLIQFLATVNRKQRSLL